MLHTKTHAYHKSMELISLCSTVMEKMPLGYGFLNDQLRRASASVALNFSEGNAKQSLKERARFFRIAKGSSYEVAAAFEVGTRFKVINQSTNKVAQDLCDHIAALLHRYR